MNVHITHTNFSLKHNKDVTFRFLKVFPILLINLNQRITPKLKASIKFEGGEVTYDEVYIR